VLIALGLKYDGVNALETTMTANDETNLISIIMFFICFC
jgi:hypothetical protein